MAPKPDTLSLKGRALRLLATREYSQVELTRKLAPHAHSPEELDKLLDELGQRGFQNDARVAESVVHAKSRLHGVSRLRQTLQTRGITDVDMAPALLPLADTEHERAWALWQRRFGHHPSPAVQSDIDEHNEDLDVEWDDVSTEALVGSDVAVVPSELLEFATDDDVPCESERRPPAKRWGNGFGRPGKKRTPSPQEIARQDAAKIYAKQSRFLLSRGFSSVVVRATLQRASAADQDDESADAPF